MNYINIYKLLFYLKRQRVHLCTYLSRYYSDTTRSTVKKIWHRCVFVSPISRKVYFILRFNLLKLIIYCYWISCQLISIYVKCINNMYISLSIYQNYFIYLYHSTSVYFFIILIPSIYRHQFSHRYIFLCLSLCLPLCLSIFLSIKIILFSSIPSFLYLSVCSICLPLSNIIFLHTANLNVSYAFRSYKFKFSQ